MMKVKLLFSVVLTITCFIEGHTLSTVRDCLGTSLTNYEYANLPGIGWDNLLNENRGKVIQFKYSQCKTTDDGLYLIPDNVFVLQVKSSSVDIFSEIIDNWKNYTSATSKSINVGGNVGIPFIFDIHGSYSSEYQEVKTNQISDNSMTVRVGARYEKYVSKLLTEIDLDDAFRDRVLTIADNLLSGQKHTARYESQLLIRDFGTHVVTSVNAGALIYKIEQLNRTAVQNSDMHRSDIAKSAGFSFFGSGIEYNHASSTSDTTVTQYLNLRTHSSVRTHGGPLFKPVNFSINEWVDGIGSNLAAIDRSGDPINFVINSNNFAQLPISIIEQTASLVEESIATYYKYNTIKGCTNVNSPNFNYIANVDDGSCHDAGVNLTFGGVFQTCSYNGDLSENLCDALTTKNPKTGADTCPVGYDVVPLFSGNTSKTEMTQECSNYFIFWKKCQNIPHFGSASFQSYWCAAVKNNVPDNSGYLFGGLFTTVFPNPLANAHGCPSVFTPLHITSDLTICVSDDYQNGERYSAPFGGLFSCQHGNPLANKYYTTGSPPKTCPSGYSEHLATEDEGCEVNYCMKTKYSVLSSQIRSPPFLRQRMERNDNSSYIISNEGTSWTSIYLVPAGFTGFVEDVKGWITNDGKDLNIIELLKAKNGATESKQSQFSESTKEGLNGFGATKERKGTRKMSLFEIAIVAAVSVIATLISIFVAVGVLSKITRKRNKKVE
ncbi:macrophage-expressed gene 1 protein-like [Mytilus galloprovincialis]|uniref:macrophage-expressed gene 1 protein-like n=1 Tax=Mytilus galloprovincialis TaxID=29158 RepID=UPI003F7BFC1C